MFVQIVESGSLSAAGRVVGLSPAMVSKRLARLEARLGVTLINRTTRRLALTESGERFYRDVLAILSAAAEAEARVSGGEGKPVGPLRISAPTSFGRLHIAPYLKSFLDTHSQIDLELNLSDGFVDLIEERVDLAIRIAPAIAPDLIARRLATSRRILCASPSYIKAYGSPATIRALANHRLLAATGQLPWRLVGRDGRNISVDGISHVRTNSSEVVRELAISGVGIAMRSLWDISHDLAEGRLVQVLSAHEGSADVGIYAVAPRQQWRSASAAAFTQFLEHLYSPRPPWES